MAASSVWRKCLNKQDIFDVLRKNTVKSKPNGEGKNLTAVLDGELYVWNAYNCSLLTTNLKRLVQKTDRVVLQNLLAGGAPKFEIENVVPSPLGHQVALWGPRGLSVLVLPHRRGKYAEFDGGKERIICKMIPVAERFLTTSVRVRVLQVKWHPDSENGMSLVVLTSDNCLRIYDIEDPQSPIHTFKLGASQVSLALSVAEGSVDFDFAPLVALQAKARPRGLEKSNAPPPLTARPVYVLWSNGDIFVVYTSLHIKSPLKDVVHGPLSMHPAAEDNYGCDACSLVCMPSQPPVLVMATSEGKLHHCVVLIQDEDESASQSTWAGAGDISVTYESPPEVSLYVVQTVELELSLRTVAIETEEVVEDDFTCPIRIHKDPNCMERYHCRHSAGVHSVVLPWIKQFQDFCRDNTDDEGFLSAGLGDEEVIVEHVLCTKPLPSSPASPVLGLCITTGHLLGPTLICLTSDLECITLPLLTSHHTSVPPLTSSQPLKPVSSPLKQMHVEPFDKHISRILQRNAGNPLLSTSSGLEMSQVECFQLLSRVTQVFREEYIQKQEQAREEIERRVRVLREQKEQQQKDLAQCQSMRNQLTESAQELAERYEDTAEHQKELVDRLETVMKKLAGRLPELSDAECSMKRDLVTVQERMKTKQNALKQVKLKYEYQSRQIAQSGQQMRSTPSLSNSQSQQLRTILKEEGDQIADMVKQINALKLKVDV